MMPAEESDSERRSGPGGAGERPLAAHRAEKEQKNKRGPDRAVEHLRPVIGSYESAESKNERPEQGSGGRAVQVPAQPIAEQGRLKMNQDEVPVQSRTLDPAVLQWSEEEQPI